MSLIDKQRMSHLARHNDTEASFIKKLEDGVKEKPTVLIVDDGSGNAGKIAALMAEHEEAVMLGTGMRDPKGMLVNRGKGVTFSGMLEINAEQVKVRFPSTIPPAPRKNKTNPHEKNPSRELKKQFSPRQLRKLEKKMGRAAAQVQANTEATPE